jgi:hypothetical protein
LAENSLRFVFCSQTLHFFLIFICQIVAKNSDFNLAQSTLSNFYNTNSKPIKIPQLFTQLKFQEDCYERKCSNASQRQKPACQKFCNQYPDRCKGAGTKNPDPNQAGTKQADPKKPDPNQAGTNQADPKKPDPNQAGTNQADPKQPA